MKPRLYAVLALALLANLDLACTGDDPVIRSGPVDAGASDASASDGGQTGSDGGAPTGDGGPPVDAGPDATAGAKLAFVTAQQYTGILAGGNGGLAAGDKACGDEAIAAGRAGTFKALLSTSAVTGIKRIGVGPWELADGTPVPARDKLVAQAILINRDASGSIATGLAWTGCDAMGEAAADTCANWSDVNVSLGQVGDIGGAGSTWLSSDTRPCSDSRRLYCFQD
jgi:hypothetical protein